MVREYGLGISIFQPIRDFEGMPEPHWSPGFDRAEIKFDVMAKIGTLLVLIFSNLSSVSVGGIDRAAAALNELGQRVARRGLKVGYEARFGLVPETSDLLRNNNLLSDRDDEGREYIQLYSRTFGAGFFFEVVERHGGYRGFGAMNAKIRIAAQRRLMPANYSYV